MYTFIHPHTGKKHVFIDELYSEGMIRHNSYTTTGKLIESVHLYQSEARDLINDLLAKGFEEKVYGST